MPKAVVLAASESWQNMTGTIKRLKLKTKVYELYSGKYKNLSELAQTMGISVSEVYRVRRGQRPINEKFIIGAMKAFPEHTLEQLFYVTPDGSQNDR